MTFAKTGNEEFDRSLDHVVYSESQIMENGFLKFDLSRFSTPNEEAERWKIAEYSMEQM